MGECSCVPPEPVFSVADWENTIHRRWSSWWHLNEDREVPGEVRKGREFSGKGNSKIKGSDVGTCRANTKRRIHRKGVRDEATLSTKCGLYPEAIRSY